MGALLIVTTAASAAAAFLQVSYLSDCNVPQRLLCHSEVVVVVIRNPSSSKLPEITRAVLSYQLE